MDQSLNGIAQAQRERLFHVDFRLRFFGSVNRQDLVTRFGIKEAAATRDLALYRELAPGNLNYDNKVRQYLVAKQYQPLFDLNDRQALSALTDGLGDDQVGVSPPPVLSESPTRLNAPSLANLAAVTRAIYRDRALEVTYHSLSSGEVKREIVPFALIDNGLRWHVRAYDRLKRRFSDFVINRFSQVSAIDGGVVEPHETREADIQWNRIVQLEIVAHPRLTHPKTIELEYGMRDGVLKTDVRAAVAGYLLRRWNVDCTDDHRLDSPEYHLWLNNRAALYGVENLAIAPGYVSDQGGGAPGRTPSGTTEVHDA